MIAVHFLEEGVQYVQEVDKCDDMLLEQCSLTSFDSPQAFLRNLFI